MCLPSLSFVRRGDCELFFSLACFVFLIVCHSEFTLHFHLSALRRSERAARQR